MSANPLATRRLTRELKALQKDPILKPKIVALPKEDNILEWHYVIEGNAGTPYEGGYYWGKLIFPPEYPLKPPSIQMLTPNGRFVTGRRLCLSMSDYHPESWNPMWGNATILCGLYSFMLETAPTAGSINTSLAQKQKLAQKSLAFNVSNAVFCTIFPDYVELHKQRKPADDETMTTADTTSDVGANNGDGLQPLLAACVIAFVSILFAAAFRYL